MRTSMYICMVAFLAAALAAPAPAPQPAAVNDQTPEIIEIIAPAASAQETLATLNLGAPGSELSERNKRTIGILRQLFPTLTQIIEQKVQQITSSVLKTFGPIVLRTFLGGGQGAGKAGGGGGTVELDDDDEDDDDDDEPLTSAPIAASPAPAVPALGAGFDVSVSASARSNAEVETEPDTEAATEASTTSDDDATTTAPERRRRRKRALFFLPNAIEENQLLSGAESQQAEVRVAFGEGAGAGHQAASEDQQGAASEDQQAAAQTASIDEISLDDADDTEENRNKRFLSFGGQGGSSGGGGGSGNFLFDIVRSAPAAMARAAGNAFRVFAGTDSLSLGLTASHTASQDPNTQLVAGSSSGAPAEGADDGEGAAKGDNLTEGVPGPITRLFIIANRGIANLIQDLILRIAQTSERIVNFKARLITSII